MNEVFVQIRLYFYICMPAILAVAMVVLSSANWQIPGFASFLPMFTVMSVFYWVIYAPSFFPKWFVFVLGLFQDLLIGAPIGVSSLVAILLWVMVFSQRRFLVRETFTVVWGTFIILSLVAGIIYFCIYSILFGELLLRQEVVLQWIVTGTFYPVVHSVLSTIFSRILKYY